MTCLIFTLMLLSQGAAGYAAQVQQAMLRVQQAMLRLQQAMLQLQQPMFQVQLAMLQVQQAMLREINNKAKLSPAELGLGLSLAISSHGSTELIL